MSKLEDANIMKEFSVNHDIKKLKKFVKCGNFNQ